MLSDFSICYLFRLSSIFLTYKTSIFSPTNLENPKIYLPYSFRSLPLLFIFLLLPTSLFPPTYQPQHFTYLHLQTILSPRSPSPHSPSLSQLQVGMSFRPIHQGHVPSPKQGQARSGCRFRFPLPLPLLLSLLPSPQLISPDLLVPFTW